MIGCTAPFGEQSRNIARNAWLQAGYPPEVPATVLDRRCGSAQTAVEMGAALVASGTHDVVIAGGVEHMGHVPMDSPGKVSELYGDPWPAELRERYDFPHHGRERRADRRPWEIGRARDGRVRRPLAPARRRGDRRRPVRRRDDPDDARRRGPPATRASGRRPRSRGLAELKPVFRPDGRPITAGSSSPLTDGAAGVLLASGEAARRHGLRKRARILDQTTVGVDPDHHADRARSRRPGSCCERNGMGIDDIDLVEVNEAFSSVVLAWERELKPDMDRVNVNGGAIALGHPVGATGSRLFATLLAEMERRDVEIGLVTMCCGGGLGTATLIQRVRR